jgi:hypothetical protein
VENNIKQRMNEGMMKTEAEVNKLERCRNGRNF